MCSQGHVFNLVDVSSQLHVQPRLGTDRSCHHSVAGIFLRQWTMSAQYSYRCGLGLWLGLSTLLLLVHSDQCNCLLATFRLYIHLSCLDLFRLNLGNRKIKMCLQPAHDDHPRDLDQLRAGVQCPVSSPDRYPDCLHWFSRLWLSTPSVSPTNHTLCQPRSLHGVHSLGWVAVWRRFLSTKYRIDMCDDSLPAIPDGGRRGLIHC